MNDDAKRAMERLRDPEGDYLQRLARMVVEDATATPLADVATPKWMASQLAASLQAATQGEGIREFVARRLEEGKDRWAHDETSLRQWMPDDVDEPLRQLLSNPWTPNEELTLRIIDQGVFHDLLKEVLGSSLRKFSKRLKQFDQDKLGGFGKRARSVGRGLFGNLADNISGATDGILGAVQSEMEGAIERRIDEFLGTATNESMKVVARHLCDPEQAEAYGEVRTQVLDVLLDAPTSELYGEFEKIQPLDAIDVVVSALRSIVARDTFVEDAERRIASLLESAGDGTLGAWLDEVGLRDVWTQSTTELISSRLVGVVQTREFESWWDELHA